ncbi:hypothetical protein KPH14_011414 [Odynerus spinipes]|uniref:Uncharacterized protein n=1 Tax=Odynerus spinipes TaxID=1348599 RepID=A0AAD9RV51_9HYME|nr:hypothetical protein KPH14_011414 [Odynerus spinipes]
MYAQIGRTLAGAAASFIQQNHKSSWSSKLAVAIDDRHGTASHQQQHQQQQQQQQQPYRPSQHATPMPLEVKKKFCNRITDAGNYCGEYESLDKMRLGSDTD